MKKNTNKKEQVTIGELENYEFAQKVYDFLLSANYLNNSENKYSCDKSSVKFASQDFLNIHKETTHKTKCKNCEFEQNTKIL